MGATLVELHLSQPLAPRAFEEAQRSVFDLPPAQRAITTTRAQANQPWLVARAHLVEELGQLFRCEVLITRQELFAPDPSVPEQVTTFWDQLADRLDDDDASDAGPTGRPDDLKSATDALRGQDWLGPPTGPFGTPSGLGGLPGAISQVASDAQQIYRDQRRDWNQGMNDWEQYLLGIAPPTTWSPELAPDPFTFLGTFRSLLLSREGAGIRLGRWVSGIVTELEDLGVFGGDRRLVRLVIEPQLAKLALRRNHRIFERMSALEILERLFGVDEAGVYLEGWDRPPVQPATRACCVQYGETDLDFVLRLCSEEGWVPVFEQHLGAERLRLVLPEDLSAGQGVAGTGEGGQTESLGPDDLPRPHLLRRPQRVDDEEVLFGFALEQRVAPPSVSARWSDFSYHPAGGPPHVREASAAADDTFAAEPAGLHLYPARTAFSFDEGEGAQRDAVEHERDAFLELAAARARAIVGRGRTNAVALATGQRAYVADRSGAVPEMWGPAVRPFDRDFLVTRLEWLAEVAPTPLGPQGATSDLPARPGLFPATGPFTFEALVEAVPAEVTYLPPRVRAPVIDGVQTAITHASVSQPDGVSFLGVDAVGRVRARLHWDREDSRVEDERSVSPPIRVAGPWAGHGWGTTFLPREGMELVVAYQDGDPAQPIALGCAYSNPVPAPRERPHLDVVGRDNHLGDPEVRGEDERLHYHHEEIREVEDRNLNGIRTRSHAVRRGAEGRAKGYHELSFDDTPRKERVRLHSEGVLAQAVERDHRTLVGRDQMNVVSGSQTETVGVDQSLRVEGAREKEIVGHERARVDGHHALTVHGDAALHVGQDRAEVVRGDVSITLGAEPGAAATRSLEVREGRRTIVEKGDDVRKVGGDVKVRVEGTYELGGAPLSMKALGESGDAAEAPGVETDEDGTMKMSAPGADGRVSIEAEGDVRIRTGIALMSGETSVRFECGEVSVELTESEIAVNAPGGIYARAAGDPATLFFAGPKEGYGDDGEVRFTMQASSTERGSKPTSVMLRASEGGDDPQDALSGDTGWKIEDADTISISGGFAALESRRVELQKGDGAKRTVRELDDEDREALAEVARCEERVEELTVRVLRLVEERDRRRAHLKRVAKLRRAIEEMIESAGGKLDELAEAIREVREAEAAVDRAERRVARARRARDEARAAKQDVSDAQDELDDAEEELEEAREDLADEEQDLAEEREEHGSIVESYESLRAQEQEAEERLRETEAELAEARAELAEARVELAKWRAKAEARELDGAGDEAEAAE